MKKRTLTVDEELLEVALRQAAVQRTTLDALSRWWLAVYVGRGWKANRVMAAIQELRETIDTSGRRVALDELNQR